MRGRVAVVTGAIRRLGVPVTEGKLMRPSTCLTSLGIDMDIGRMIRCLLSNKLREVQGLVRNFLH